MRANPADLVVPGTEPEPRVLTPQERIFRVLWANRYRILRMGGPDVDASADWSEAMFQNIAREVREDLFG